MPFLLPHLVHCLVSLLAVEANLPLQKAPELPAPNGLVVHVSSTAELFREAESASPRTTIVLAAGEYVMERPLVLNDKTNIVLRSASGDPNMVTLRGKGWTSSERGGDLLRIAHCDTVTIAGLTFADARSYGIKVEAENAPREVLIYNCRFRDIGVRAIKGSAGNDPAVRAVGGGVRYCSFENTKVPPADWIFNGDYIGAIDMMALDGWTFSDNSFRNIKGRNGGGRAAIFIWVRSRDVTVERNVILDCDRGIAFGNPGASTANREGEQTQYVTDGVIQNNWISGGADCGIELWHAREIRVLHNSIFRPEQNFRRGIRVGTGTRAMLQNNLVHGEITLEGGEARSTNNLTGQMAAFFTDAAAGDLSLTSGAGAALDAVVPISPVKTDIRNLPRDNTPDIGAWERR